MWGELRQPPSTNSVKKYSDGYMLSLEETVQNPELLGRRARPKLEPKAFPLHYLNGQQTACDQSKKHKDVNLCWKF